MVGSIPASPRSGRDHFFVIFGMSWEVSGSGLGTLLTGLARFWKEMPDGVKQNHFSKMAGSVFPESGALQNSMFNTSPDQINNRKYNISMFP